MNINEIKAAVDAARERQRVFGCPFCGRFNKAGSAVCIECGAEEPQKHRSIIPQEQADAALIALWEQTQEQESTDD